MARLGSICSAAAAAILVLPLLLGGCAGILVVGGLAGAAGGGYIAAQERGVDGIADDYALKTAIESRLIKANPALQAGITTTVYQGRVLLTGQVATAAMKTMADGLAGSTPGVRALYSEVEVAPAPGMWDDAKDTWITAQLRSQLIIDRDIRSTNYTIDTANGSVYLIGSARSQSELDRVTDIARYIQGVRRVISYVELRPGASATPVAATPAPSAQSATPAPADTQRPAPRDAIEVQRL
jgi:osmotically-inducible protein OsmY